MLRDTACADASPQKCNEFRSNPYLSAPPFARNGHALEGIVHGPRQPGSLFDEGELSFAPPPSADSREQMATKRVYDMFARWLAHMEKCDEVEVEDCFARLVNTVHCPPARDYAQRKSLPKHVPSDRRDPIALVVTAVQLIHDAVGDARWGRGRADMHLLRYVQARLAEAERVQVFQMIRALPR